ncbi:MAG: rhomboid family intramembrane serine protease [Azoarcus sp.]|jgi:membrane associated rhomboid family serine protease|nr:rhomboid family intramembrane serine protease [Azoarcus sp.]
MLQALYHAGALHLVSNIVGMLIFAPALGRRLGVLRTLSIVAAAILVGDVSQTLYNHAVGDVRPTIGASAAMFGLLGAYGALFPFYRPCQWLLPARLLAYMMLTVSCAAAVLSPYSSIAHAAHVGGLLVGLFASRLFRVHDWKIATMKN